MQIQYKFKRNQIFIFLAKKETLAKTTRKKGPGLTMQFLYHLYINIRRELVSSFSLY